MQDSAPKVPAEREGHEEIEASKAPLMDHLIELRQRLIRSLAAFALMFVVCFYFAKQIFNILVWPYVQVVGSDKARLIATHFLEQLYTNIRLAMFGAAFLAFPVAAFQLYKFVAPGLYKNEKQAFRPYLFATFVLFGLGAMLVYFVVMPLVIRFSLDITPQAGGNGYAEIDLLPKVSEYLSFMMTLVLGFGVCFQLPVVLTLLARAGIVNAQMLTGFRRYAIVAITAVTAVLSPPDPFRCWL
jgi:sec-independent protein translocase protein TatC